MRKYTESYPTICVGRILTYPSYGSLQDCHQRAFDVHLGDQSSRLVAWDAASAKRSHCDIYYHLFVRVMAHVFLLPKTGILDKSCIITKPLPNS